MCYIFFMERRCFESRKITPNSRSNNGVVHNASDVPLVERKTLGKLAVFTPGNRFSGVVDGHLIARGETIEARYSINRGVIVVPTTEVPLTGIFYTGHGGGRVGGGGLSQEALRRARKKARRM